MPVPDRLSLRLVVQRICESSSGQSFYRLIAYGDNRTYRPVQFEALDDVLKVLKAALPRFDASLISRGNQGATSIVFADEVELSKEQLSVLGLTQ